MTALVGASVFLIAGSAIALVFGWITADESLIWTSIAASVAGAVCLSLAYFRSREETVAVARADAPEPEPIRPKAAAPTTVTEEVVGIPRSKRFHRPGCRYAAAKNGQNMTKTDALRVGYTPCGVCKP